MLHKHKTDRETDETAVKDVGGDQIICVQTNTVEDVAP